WSLRDGVPSTGPAVAAIEASPSGSRLAFEAAGLAGWDSSLVSFVHTLARAALGRGVAVDASALPRGARRLVELALAVHPRVITTTPPDDALTARVGRVALEAMATARDFTTFLGETVLASLAALRGRARFRRADLMHAFESSGVAALGIVALINFLIGAVLAFVGAVQLQPFGATLYVASLVAIGVTRELGPLMTGIVMAGRTGASFAAVLGTMSVNEEVDALLTTGLKPAEFLVFPRVLATTLMMPALVAYADLLGLLGGMFVGVSVLDLGAVEYLRLSRDSLPMRHVVIGLVKSLAFGVVIALTGCYYGVRCGRSAAAVGEAATRAVVVGIVLVVVVDAVFTVLLHLVRL
ncbi:MAG TPA: ABC transporter permease, partial [Vicinamibacteria bacterium]|nr:ABC transporter permease [Vicinamibacteria bacterium]